MLSTTRPFLLPAIICGIVGFVGVAYACEVVTYHPFKRRACLASYTAFDTPRKINEPSYDLHSPNSCLLTTFLRPVTNESNQGVIEQKGRLREIANELGLLQSATIGSVDDRTSPPPTVNHIWKVTADHVNSLESLPKKASHSGNYEWDGPEKTSPPKWLWDSHLSKTVATTSEHLEEGYMAISYTWGRWRVGSSNAQGTDWSVPKINPKVFGEMLEALKAIIQDIPTCRYFWIDVLCINQDDRGEKEEEISKQASIFGQAKGTLVYLWSLDSEDELAQAMANFGDILLWSLHFSSAENAGGRAFSDLEGASKLPEHLKRLLDAKLRLDPWFSSLWALQEMVLSPSSIWMTRNGRICKVNGRILTTRFLALATELLAWSIDFRNLQWVKLLKEYVVKVNDRDTIALEDTEELFERRMDLEESDRRSKELWAKSATSEERTSIESRFSDIQPLSVWVTSKDYSIRDAPDWIHKRLREEEHLLRSAKRWVDWAFGEACITVSTKASRTAILVAGINRQSAKRRGEAVLSALKIAYRPEFGDDKQTGPGGLPISLINHLVKIEGAALFYVSHEYRFQMESRKDSSALFSPWAWGPPQDGTGVHLTGPGTAWHFRSGELSGMLPTTASFYHPKAVDWPKYSPVVSEDWHIHPDGALHLPFGTQIQKIGPLDTGRMTVWKNGFPAEMEVEMLGLATMMVAGQDLCTGYLGEGCQVRFLPLLIRNETESFSISLKEPFAPQVIGVVLVGKPDLKSDVSMTYWHKYGLYAAASFNSEELTWRDGILVGAIGTATTTPRSKDDCPLYQDHSNAEEVQSGAMATTSTLPAQTGENQSSVNVDRASDREFEIALTQMNQVRSLAELYLEQGRHAEAEQLLVRTKNELPEQYGTLLIGETLAAVFIAQERWEDAIRVLAPLRDVRRKVLGREDVNTLTTTSNLGYSYAKLKRWNEAEILQLEVMDGFKKVLEPGNPDIAGSMTNLAGTYFAQDRFEEAEKLQADVMRMLKEELGETNPRTLTSMIQLASTYSRQHRSNEAEQLQGFVWKTKLETLGPRHPETLQIMNNLAVNYMNHQRWAEAEKVQTQICEITREVLGLKHPSTLEQIGRLALVHGNQQHWAEARELESEIVVARIESLGRTHPLTLHSLENMAQTYRGDGDLEKAQKILRLVLQTRKSSAGSSPQDIILTTTRLADTLWDQEQWEDAEALFLQAIEMNTEALGPQDPTTQVCREQLAQRYLSRGKVKEAEALQAQNLAAKPVAPG